MKLEKNKKINEALDLLIEGGAVFLMEVIILIANLLIKDVLLLLLALFEVYA